MYYKTLLIFLFFSFAGQAETEKRIAIGFVKSKSVKDSSLSKNEALYTFQLRRIDASIRFATIQYSIDGKEATATLDDGSFDVKATPGKHKFQIYINEHYYESYSDSLNILGGYHDTYNVYVQYAEIEVISDKPVIYLYPTKEQNISVSVKAKGELSFTYPEYNGAWNVKAKPDGTITHNGSDFNYLFWEAKRSITLEEVDFSKGFIVEKDNVQTFLEEKLRAANFTAIERADFITYWAPRMLHNELLFVQFVQNDACNQFAELDISPKPQSLERFYITWMPIDETFKLNEQTILPIQRDGFTVLEWGGQEIK